MYYPNTHLSEIRKLWKTSDMWGLPDEINIFFHVFHDVIQMRVSFD